MRHASSSLEQTEKSRVEERLGHRHGGNLEKGKKEEEEYCDGGVDTLDIALLDEDFHGLETEGLDLRLLEGLASFELLNLPVQLRHFLSYFLPFFFLLFSLFLPPSLLYTTTTTIQILKHRY